MKTRCTCEFRDPQRPEEGFRSPGNGVLSVWKPPNMDAKNQTHVLRKTVYTVKLLTVDPSFQVPNSPFVYISPKKRAKSPDVFPFIRFFFLIILFLETESLVVQHGLKHTM